MGRKAVPFPIYGIWIKSECFSMNLSIYTVFSSLHKKYQMELKRLMDNRKVLKSILRLP
jgi:hypothetical protein